MELVTRSATINLNPSQIPQYIDVSQYDHDYVILLTVVDDSGSIESLVDDESVSLVAKMQGKKPSGEPFSIVSSRSYGASNVFDFILSSDATNESGNVESEIVFFDESETVTQRVASANFILRVKKSPYPIAPTE